MPCGGRGLDATIDMRAAKFRRLSETVSAEWTARLLRSSEKSDVVSLSASRALHDLRSLAAQNVHDLSDGHVASRDHDFAETHEKAEFAEPLLLA